MAKLTAFFISALAVALCLWIDLVHFPDAFSPQGAQTSTVSEKASPKNDKSDALPNEKTFDDSKRSTDAPTETPDREENVQPKREPTFANASVPENAETASYRSVSATNVADEKSTTESGRANFQPATMTREIPDEENASDAAPSNAPQGVPAQTKSPAPKKASNDAASSRRLASKSTASKPQGGKYVSIPSVETDAFGRRTELDCRVVGTTSAKRLSILSIDETGYNGYAK